MIGYAYPSALRYFTTVKEALRKYDEHHLYLGCRFAWSTPEAVRAAEQTCDVVSFNVYKRRLERGDPAFVGTHWFQYVDEPLTGRTLDGENYNIGFVSVTDTPYPEMVAADRDRRHLFISPGSNLTRVAAAW